MPKGIEKPKDPRKKKRQRTIKQRRQDKASRDRIRLLLTVVLQGSGART